MQIAVSKEGPRAPLFCLGLAILLAVDGTVNAQEVSQADLQRCASLPTIELKLACFEALATQETVETEAPTEMVLDPQTTIDMPEVPVAAGAAVGIAAESEVDIPDEPTVVIPEPEQEVQQTLEPVAASPTAVPTSTAVVAAEDNLQPGSAEVVTTPDIAQDVQTNSIDQVTTPVIAQDVQENSIDQVTTPVIAQDVQENSVDQVTTPVIEQDVQTNSIDQLGEKYLEDDEEKESLIRVTVNKVEKGRNDILFFYFENGQVWRQNESRHFGYPRGQAFDVTINTGWMGDHRMRLADGGPMVRIRRVK